MWTKIKNTSKSLQIQGTFKKLEYSADKFASSSKHKHSNSKKNEKKPDRSMEIDNRSKDYFEIRRSDRKNTLSGHKRTNRFHSHVESPGNMSSFYYEFIKLEHVS